MVRLVCVPTRERGNESISGCLSLRPLQRESLEAFHLVPMLRVGMHKFVWVMQEK